VAYKQQKFTSHSPKGTEAQDQDTSKSSIWQGLTSYSQTWTPWGQLSRVSSHKGTDPIHEAPLITNHFSKAPLLNSIILRVQRNANIQDQDSHYVKKSFYSEVAMLVYTERLHREYLRWHKERKKPPGQSPDILGSCFSTFGSIWQHPCESQLVRSTQTYPTWIPNI
jgi:hypothetical protein